MQKHVFYEEKNVEGYFSKKTFKYLRIFLNIIKNIVETMMMWALLKKSIVSPWRQYKINTIKNIVYKFNDLLQDISNYLKLLKCTYTDSKNFKDLLLNY